MSIVTSKPLALLAVVGVLACTPEVIESDYQAPHCSDLAGDLTCAETHADAAPFCSDPAPGCPGASTIDGCVTTPPAADCHRPCGADESACTTLALVCGDGRTEGSEECDDGNDIADDGCTSMCTRPTCGDGIVQASVGEQCDEPDRDGSCTADCRWRASERWRVVLGQLGSDADLSATAVAMSADATTLAILAQTATCDSSQLAAFASDTGELRWATATLTCATSLAAGPDGQVAVTGVEDQQAGLALYDGDGLIVWEQRSTCSPSQYTDVAIDERGAVWAVGACGEPILAKYALDDGALVFERSNREFTRLEAVVAVPGGGVRAVARHADDALRVLQLADADQLDWTSASIPAHRGGPVDLDLDDRGHTYLTSPDRWWTPRVTELDAKGYVTRRGRPLGGARASLATLPSLDGGAGGVVITAVHADHVSVERTDPDGLLLSREALVPRSPGARLWVEDLVTASERELIAVGGHRAAPDQPAQLLIVRFELRAGG